MFETILLVGNGALSSSLQKFLKKERVVVFDKDNIDRLIHTKGDLLIDCSLPDAFDSVYAYLKKNRIPAIICATNHSKEQYYQMKELSKSIPLFKSENLSLGIALIDKILRENKNIVKNYDLFLFDFHHRSKKDSPSGTGKKIAEILDHQVNIVSVRSKNIIGEHQIRLFDEDEEITITHKATSKDLFARGILKAIDWIDGKEPGYYGMEDLIDEI